MFLCYKTCIYTTTGWIQVSLQVQNSTSGFIGITPVWLTSLNVRIYMYLYWCVYIYIYIYSVHIYICIFLSDNAGKYGEKGML